MVFVLLPGKIVDTADVSAHRARREKIEKHADEIVSGQILVRGADAQRAGQHGPSQSANYLGAKIYHQGQSDIGKVR